MKITAHFDDSEFFSPDKSGPVTASDRIKASFLCRIILEPARAALGRVLHVNSGKRSALHNRKVGGVPTSEHLWYADSAAVDVDTRDPERNAELFRWLYHNRLFVIGQVIAYVDVEGRVRFIHSSIISSAKQSEALTATYETVNGKRRYSLYRGGTIRRP